VRKTLGILAGIAGVVACTVQTIFPYGTGPLPGSGSAIVGAGGGLVTANDGTTLFIPPGALIGDVTVTVGLAPAAADIPQARALAAAHLFGPPGLAFAKPACVTLSFEPALLPEGTTETSVVLYAAVGDAGDYAPLPTLTTDPTHVTGITSQLGTIVAAYGSAQEVDASDASCDASVLDALEEIE
jgi:hypothetical protein